jgi:hypothetical protein
MDTKWTFDRSSRNLFVKNIKDSNLKISRRPYKYSFDEIEDVKTVVETVTESINAGSISQSSRSHEVYRILIVLKSNKESNKKSNKKLIMSTDEKIPINQERQAEIVSLIKNYLS